jgi:hypothetical protein
MRALAGSSISHVVIHYGGGDKEELNLFFLICRGLLQSVATILR